MTETPPVRLVVVGPGKQVYGTRALVAGDQFEMPRQFAEVLVLLGKARLADEKPAPSEPEPPEQSTDRSRELNELRAEATRLGILWDGRWGAVRLNHEIAQATGKTI